MTGWTAPTRDTLFVIEQVLGLDAYRHLPAFAALDQETLSAIVEEAGKFCAEVVAPLNLASDREGCTRHGDGRVTTPTGFREAYRQMVDAGWLTLGQPVEYGGQGMPHVLGSVMEEYLNSACAGFMMFPGAMGGAVATVNAAGSEELKRAYLPKMVSGEWLATMALTEAHAGTDLGLMRTAAKPRGNGSYGITGQKIFISGGEHDLTENIIHLVLARLPDAPAGTRGISLFLVPKVLDGGERNAVSCGSIEHKMGLHGSATCVMNFDDATGWLLGEPHGGLAAMFIMMNAARLGVGTQGLAHAEHSYQRAAAYALDRRQGRAAGERADPAAAADPLIVHPDVRRMLLDARAFAESFRALVAWTALQIDLSHTLEDKAERRAADAMAQFLTPVIKGYGTDRGFESAVAMQQVLGGHGYVAEWGMEQIVRDARIAMIYEGANGVQALDLAGRKLARDGGAVAARFFALVEADAALAPAEIGAPLLAALADARAGAEWLITNAGADPDNLGAGSYAFMQLVGMVALGWMWAKMAAIAARDPADAFMAAKLIVARHFAEQSLPLSGGLLQRVKVGAGNLMTMPAEAFLRA